MWHVAITYATHCENRENFVGDFAFKDDINLIFSYQLPTPPPHLDFYRQLHCTLPPLDFVPPPLDLISRLSTPPKIFPYPPPPHFYPTTSSRVPELNLLIGAITYIFTSTTPHPWISFLNWLPPNISVNPLPQSRLLLSTNTPPFRFCLLTRIHPFSLQLLIFIDQLHHSHKLFCSATPPPPNLIFLTLSDISPMFSLQLPPPRIYFPQLNPTRSISVNPSPNFCSTTPNPHPI